MGRRLLMSLVLVVALPVPSAQAQVLGPPNEIAVAPIHTPTDGTQSHSWVAYDGTGFLLAYADRSGRRFARAAVDGTVTELDSRPVFRFDCRDDGECAGLTSDDPDGDGLDVIYSIVRFSRDGTVHDDAPVPLFTVPRYRGAQPEIVAHGSGWVVGFADSAGGIPLRLYSVTSTTVGAPVDVVGFASYWDVACADETCAFAWRESTTLAVRRFRTDGSAIDATPLIVPLTILDPGEVLAGWDSSQFRILVQGNTLASAGIFVPETGPITAPVASIDRIRSPPAFACRADDGACIIGTAEGVRWWRADIPPSGLPLGTPGPFTTAGVACSATQCVWLRTEASTVRGSVFSTDGLDFDFGVGGSADLQAGPVAVAGRLVLFHRQLPEGWSLIARPLDASGSPTGVEQPLTIMRAGPEPVSLVASGDGYAAIVRDVDGVSFRQLDALGASIGEPAPLGPCDGPTPLASNGIHLLSLCVGAGGAVVARRLDEIGQRVDPSGTILTTGAQSVDVASDGDGWLAVVSNGSAIRAYRIAADASISEPAGELVRDHGVGEVRVAELATGGHVVAWREVNGDFGEPGELRAGVLAADGMVTPVGGARMGSMEGPRFVGGRVELALAPTSDGVFVTWEVPSMVGRRVVISALSGSGEPGGFADVNIDPVLYRDYDGIALGGEPMVVVYRTSDVEPSLAPSRVRTRIVLPPGGCLDADHCGGGVCVSGRCCDRACDGACEECASGTCTPRPTSFECRAATSSCDMAERCDGLSAACPGSVETTCDGAVELDGGEGVDTGAPEPTPTGCACRAGAPGGWPDSTAAVITVGALLAARRRRAPRR